MIFAVTACSNASGQSGSTVAIANPDYVPIGEQSDTGNTVRVTVPMPGAGEGGDVQLSLAFGLAVAAYKDDGAELAAALSLQRSGERPEKAYVIDGSSRPADAVKVALSFVAKLYPARRDIHAYLLNGPGKIYVAQIDFMDGSNPRRLYFDLTAWADAIKAGA
jgi:hypothetical protein